MHKHDKLPQRNHYSAATATATALFATRERDRQTVGCSIERWGGGCLEKNKYIKMPAGKMKIQTNALIRDAETLLENVSRRWLLATATEAAAPIPPRGHSLRRQ